MEAPDLVLPTSKLSTTPSERDGISRSTERQYRVWACEIICQAGLALGMPQSCIATAETLFQRFFYQESLLEYDAHTTAMACIFITSKVEDFYADSIASRSARTSNEYLLHTLNLYDVAEAFFYVYQRRTNAEIGCLDENHTLRSLWADRIRRTEPRIVAKLGGNIYNIMEHPHKYILYYIKILDGTKELARKSWAYLNDSLRLDLCVRFHSESIACGAIYLAARALQFALPTSPPWYTVFGAERHEIEEIAAHILSLYEEPCPAWLPSLRGEDNPHVQKEMKASEQTEKLLGKFQSEYDQACKLEAEHQKQVELEKQAALEASKALKNESNKSAHSNQAKQGLPGEHISTDASQSSVNGTSSSKPDLSNIIKVAQAKAFEKASELSQRAAPSTPERSHKDSRQIHQDREKPQEDLSNVPAGMAAVKPFRGGSSSESDSDEVSYRNKRRDTRRRDHGRRDRRRDNYGGRTSSRMRYDRANRDFDTRKRDRAYVHGRHERRRSERESRERDRSRHERDRSRYGRRGDERDRSRHDRRSGERDRSRHDRRSSERDRSRQRRRSSERESREREDH